jgi:hypothetical protein
MTPTITDDQRQALAEGQGAPVYVVDTATQATFVLIPAESYQRIRALFGGDDPFDIRDTYAIQDQAAEQAWSHPEDAAYDSYDAQRGQQ